MTKKIKSVKKYNLEDAEDLWGSVLSEESTDNEDDFFGLDDFLYDDASDDAGENEEAITSYDEQLESVDNPHDETFFDDETEDEHIAEEITPESSEKDFTSAILEYVGGARQEVARAKLFQPLENSILILDEEINDENVVFFDQLTCLLVSCLPAGISDKRKENCTKEIIETIDGNVYHELVHSDQYLDNLLICLSAEDQAPFIFTLFPKSNIKKRTQNKQLTDILLEKRFISKMMLQKALQEYEQVKSMTLEKLIAQKARIAFSEIEDVLNQAQQNHMQGLQKEEILLFSGLANEDEILDAVEYLEYAQNLTLEQFLIEKGDVKEREIYISLAEMHKIPFVDLAGRKLSRKSLASLPESMILQYEILPLAMKDDVLLVATHSHDMTHLSEDIIQASDCKNVKFVLSPPTDIRKIIHLVCTRRK